MKHERKILNKIAKEVLTKIGCSEERPDEVSDSVKFLMEKHKVNSENFGTFYNDFPRIFKEHVEKNMNVAKVKKCKIGIIAVGANFDKEASQEAMKEAVAPLIKKAENPLEELSKIFINGMQNGEKHSSILGKVIEKALEVKKIIEELEGIEIAQKEVPKKKQILNYYILAEKFEEGQSPLGFVEAAKKIIKNVDNGTVSAVEVEGGKDPLGAIDEAYDYLGKNPEKIVFANKIGMYSIIPSVQK